MKGMVFTEFFEMVEDEFGLETADALITATAPASQGVYTAVGNYDHAEMVDYVVQLSERSGVPVADLLHAFGRYLFTTFVKRYARFFDGVDSAMAFLASIESNIHVEVHKLYPDAELPRFSYPERGDDRLVMDYHSTRPLAHFAHGLVDGCVAHFDDQLDVEMIDLSDGAGTSARFVITTRTTA